MRAAALRAVEGLCGPRPRPVQPYEALPEEREAVKQYALKHPEVRHRELEKAHGGRGRGVPEPLDGLQHFAGGKAGLPLNDRARFGNSLAARTTAFADWNRSVVCHNRAR